MALVNDPLLLILETSGRVGQVALARGATVLAQQRLNEARRHARDLAPTIGEMLTTHGCTPRDLDGVLVSRGPGSYTGLRVGIMSAKALAYATSCTLLAVDTFAAIALQAPEPALHVEVLADAQQERVYAQRYRRVAAGERWTPVGPLVIEKFALRVENLEDDVWFTGPGLERYAGHLPQGCKQVAQEKRDPHPESLLQLGLARFLAGERDDVFAVEPLYLRPSSAEEQWHALGRT